MAKRLRHQLSRLLPSFNSCRSSSSTSTSSASPKPPNPPSSPSSDRWREEPIWHVTSLPSPRLKIDSDDGEDLFPPLSLPRPSYRRAMQEQHHSHRRRRRRRRGKKAGARASSSSADASGFSDAGKGSGVLLRRVVTCGEEKVRGSLAVVKRSDDPRGDFRRSMAEMVAERGLFGEDDLRGLLRCFLSLNSPDHHAAIHAAFSEVCQALFLAASPP